jgi:hypothetical protein
LKLLRLLDHVEETTDEGIVLGIGFVKALRYGEVLGDADVLWRIVSKIPHILLPPLSSSLASV